MPAARAAGSAPGSARAVSATSGSDQREVERAGVELRERGEAVRRMHDAVAGAAQQRAHHVGHDRVVLHQQHPARRGAMP